MLITSTAAKICGVATLSQSHSEHIIFIISSKSPKQSHEVDGLNIPIYKERNWGGEEGWSNLSRPQSWLAGEQSGLNCYTMPFWKRCHLEVKSWYRKFSTCNFRVLFEKECELVLAIVGKADTATVDSPPWFTSLLSQLDNLNSAQGSTFDFALASTNHVPIVLTGNSYVKLVPTIPLFI